MRTTLDIPDAMYRRIRVRTAQEGNTVRGITLVLYAKWLDETPEADQAVPASHKRRNAPSWFGSVKVDPEKPHDMASVRESIAARIGD